MFATDGVPEYSIVDPAHEQIEVAFGEPVHEADWNRAIDWIYLLL